MKDWLKDIHDRMADFETDEPQGLWDGICAAEPVAAEMPVVGGHKNRYGIWIGSTAAVAACMLLFWFFRPEQKQGHAPLEISAERIVAVDPNPSIDHQALPSGLKQEELPREVTRRNPSIAHTTRPNETWSQVEQQNIEEPPSAIGTLPSDDSNTAVKQEQLAQVQRETPQKRYEYLAQASPKRHGVEPRLTIGLSTSGGLGSDNRELFQNGYQGASAKLNESDWVDRPLLGFMALNRGTETERTVSHHTPVRTGLSLSYRLNDRWSVESGLSYAFVSSDIHEGSIANYIEEEQTLHYVGIPLGATYRLFTWKHLDLYLSSNILAEQCISGQSNKKYIIGDKMQGGEERTSIQSRPMQWSVSAKVGVQYNLNSVLSIYAEPGCSYYFDDHSSLETVFKDKELDFNLNLGLRFTPGKQ